tara:strand:- start:2499 stop:2771 length:273 start_codon:yes stop_codon:yes gene_type:complete
MFGAGHDGCRSWRIVVEWLSFGVSFWCAVHIDVHWVWSFIFLKGCQTAYIAEGDRIALGNQYVRWSYVGVTESILVHGSESISQAVHPIQ